MKIKTDIIGGKSDFIIFIINNCCNSRTDVIIIKLLNAKTKCIVDSSSNVYPIQWMCECFLVFALIPSESCCWCACLNPSTIIINRWWRMCSSKMSSKATNRQYIERGRGIADSILELRGISVVIIILARMLNLTSLKSRTISTVSSLKNWTWIAQRPSEQTIILTNMCICTVLA